MANYISMGRSNYFPIVKERMQLIEKLFSHDIQVVYKNETAAVLAIHDSDPTCMIDDDRTTDLLFDLQIVDADNIDFIQLLDVLHMALPQGETLVWMTIGNEKLRYLVGEAFRINSEGELVNHVDLNSIYREGESRAEY